MIEALDRYSHLSDPPTIAKIAARRLNRLPADRHPCRPLAPRWSRSPVGAIEWRHAYQELGKVEVRAAAGLPPPCRPQRSTTWPAWVQTQRGFNPGDNAMRRLANAIGCPLWAVRYPEDILPTPPLPGLVAGKHFGPHCLIDSASIPAATFYPIRKITRCPQEKRRQALATSGRVRARLVPANFKAEPKALPNSTVMADKPAVAARTTASASLPTSTAPRPDLT